MTRVVFRVTWLRRARRWKIRGGSITWFWWTKGAAIAEARAYARSEWRLGRPAQLVVHRKDGRIAWEATYGRDPRPARGSQRNRG